MRLSLCLTGLTFALGLAGCDGSCATITPPEPAPPTETNSAAVEIGELEPKAAIGRSKARWDAIADGEWIQAYDFLSPARKRQVSLNTFMQNKGFHEYTDPSEPNLLGGEQDQAFVELSVVWTTHDPRVTRADNYENLTQQLDVVETWQWVEGNWCWISTERQNDFLLKHPEYRR